MNYCTRPTFDDRDRIKRDSLLAKWNERSGARVGDWVIMPDGSERRFTYDWGDEIQTTMPGSNASFYFGYGHMDFSGGLDRPIPKSALVDTGQVRDGSAWFFHHGEVRGHNGVYFNVPCRVFNYQPKESA